ncbi:MAG: hypothetical protein Q4E55_03575 [Bacteroidales bacterium]|nr:hypothetical protein [Bacteroidales bacterium]
MKKTFVFVLMAATLGFTSCSNGDDVLDENTQQGMVLRATVEQPAEARAEITDDGGKTWKFAFTDGDKVSVTNTKVTDYYEFTNNDGTNFKSDKAKVTEGDATWYAYFPSESIDLTNQSGTRDGVANKYALAGATGDPTTGAGGLEIDMSPQVAILMINSQMDLIKISVETEEGKWVKGLTAASNNASFTLDTVDNTVEAKPTLLDKSGKDTYYIAVPAGVIFSIYNGGSLVKKTNKKLVAGMYYKLDIK